MPYLERDKFFESVSKRIEGDSSPEAIQFMEDMTDTYNELTSRAENDAENWKQKYEENDKAWAEKYKARFFNGGYSDPYTEPASQQDEGVAPEDITIESLFEDERKDK